LTDQNRDIDPRRYIKGLAYTAESIPESIRRYFFA